MPKSSMIKSLTNRTNCHNLDFQVHSVELNRQYKLHRFDYTDQSIKLMASYNFHENNDNDSSFVHLSRIHYRAIRLPVGRYLLTPINLPNSSTSDELLISIYSIQQSIFDSGVTVGHLKLLTQDMPRYQLASFLSPRYPVAVSRVVIHGVDGLTKQDRFGCKFGLCL